jgi:hypothetical protein
MGLHFPPFRLDVNNEQLGRERQEVSLRPKTFVILCYLAEHSVSEWQTRVLGGFSHLRRLSQATLAPGGSIQNT